MGHLCIARRDFNAAVNHYTRAITLQPDLAIAYMKRGLAWYSLGKHDRAADDFTRLLGLTPHDAVALNNRAMAYWQLKRTDEALADLDRALELSPENKEFLVNRGGARSAVGNFSGAINDSLKAIRLDGTLASPRYTLAAAYDATGQHDAAMEQFTHAMSLDPVDADVGLARRAHCLYSLGKPTLAMRDVNQAIELSPSPEAHLVRATLFVSIGQMAKAAADARRGLKLLDDKNENYRDRGLLFLWSGDLESALADFERMMEREPRDGVHYNNRGYVWHQRGDFERAIADYETAIRLSPEHPHAYRNLASLRANCADRRFRDGAKAVEAAQRALELRRWNQRDWFPVLANAYAEAGDLSAAEHWLREAQQLESSTPITAPPYTKPVPTPREPFQFSLREVMLVLTALAVALTLARLIEDAIARFDAEFPDRPEFDFDPCLGIFSIPILFFVGRTCWRIIRHRRPGSRAFALGAVSAGAVGIAHGLIWLLQLFAGASDLWPQLPAFVLVWMLIWGVVIGGGSKTLFLTGIYAIAGGFAAYLLDAALNRMSRRRNANCPFGA